MRNGAPLGPWPKGIDQVSDPASLLADPRSGAFIACQDALNVDIDRDGRPSVRPGRALKIALDGVHSAWSSRLGAFAVAGTTLYALSTAAATAIGTINSPEPCSYCVHTDAVIVSNRTTLLEVRAGVVEALGVPDVSAPHLTASAVGGLNAGRYTVGVAMLRGAREGALSRLRTIAVTQGGGITLDQLPSSSEATALRIYVTEPNGGELYHVTDIALGLPSFIIGAGPRSQATAFPKLRRMPPGDFVTSWRGRLLLARGRTLYFSEPMNPGLYSPRHGFVQLADPITMIAPVEAGVFVGTREGVIFLRGARPGEWVREVTGAVPPIPRSYTTTTTAELDPGMQLTQQALALWLAPNGYVIGTDDGHLIELQADRINAVRGSRAASIVYERRARTAIVE